MVLDTPGLDSVLAMYPFDGEVMEPVGKSTPPRTWQRGVGCLGRFLSRWLSMAISAKRWVGVSGLLYLCAHRWNSDCIHFWVSFCWLCAVLRAPAVFGAWGGWKGLKAKIDKC